MLSILTLLFKKVEPKEESRVNMEEESLVNMEEENADEENMKQESLVNKEEEKVEEENMKQQSLVIMEKVVEENADEENMKQESLVNKAEENAEDENMKQQSLVNIEEGKAEEEIATTFSCTMMLGNKWTAFARTSFTEGPQPLDVGNACKTLFVLDSHIKAIDFVAVEAFLGGKVYHGQGPALRYTKRGGHEKRSYCSSSR